MTFPFSLGKERFKDIFSGTFRFLEPGKHYLRFTVNKEEGKLKISVNNFPQPVTTPPSSDQVLYETKSDVLAHEYLLNYTWNLHFNPEMGLSPCENDFELIIL
ncbi:MAG: hypothetical protein N4A45_11350 [Flavobacteriales bacterium]|jgi:hypothetical protein|nr:hypothetical protein [Flavobacteriales bacterium]